MLFSERLPIYALRMTISGGTTEQHVIIASYNVLLVVPTAVIAAFLPRHWL